MLNIPLFPHSSVSPAHFAVNAKPARMFQGSYGQARRKRIIAKAREGFTVDVPRLICWSMCLFVTAGFWAGVALAVRWIIVR